MGSWLNISQYHNMMVLLSYTFSQGLFKIKSYGIYRLITMGKKSLWFLEF